MAALGKSFQKIAYASRILNNLHATRTTVLSKRFLRVDPEEEIDRLYLNESFEKRHASDVERMQQHLQSFKNIGRKPTSLPPTSDKSFHITTEHPEDLPSADFSFGIQPIPRTVVQQDDYFYDNDCTHAIDVLHHYNIFYDLFNDALLFKPDYGMNFKVAFGSDSGDVLPVFQGNKIDPHLCAEGPLVGFTGQPNKLYSLLFLNLDGHLSETQKEYLHWSCMNMRGDEGVTSGVSTEYLQPIPLRGTGFHRYVFLLIEHNEEIDQSLIPVKNWYDSSMVLVVSYASSNVELHNISPASVLVRHPSMLLEVIQGDLSSRTFSFAQFFSKIADTGAVPVGIHFFQSEWDSSVRQTFHHLLDMPEPAFEYDYPQKKRPHQVKYAHREPFQRYLDMYRDKKEVAEEVLKEHLSEISPYKPLEDQQRPYPLATPTKPGLYADQLPATWIQDNLKHKVNKTYKYKYIYKSD